MLVQGSGLSSLELPCHQRLHRPQGRRSQATGRRDRSPTRYLIQISFSSPNAIEAAEVVNQVVFVFEQQNKEFNTGMNQVLRTNYESYLEKLNQDIKDKQDEMIALAERLERQVLEAHCQG